MPTTALDRFLALVPAAYERYLADVEAAFDAFFGTVADTIRGVGWWDLAVFAANPLVGGALLYNEIAVGLLDAITELQQDLGLAPRRAILSIVDEVIPVPDYLKTRVMRSDEAIRWAVASLLEFSTAVLDADTPQWFDSFKDTGKIIKLKEFLDAPGVDAGVQLAKKNGVSIAILIISRFALQLISWGVVAGAAMLVFLAHEDPLKGDFVARSLPQTSTRRRVTESHQTRRWET